LDSFYDLSVLGAVIGDGSYFVTTPNASYIPEPPLGKLRRTIIRTDDLYAADDPLQWPQFINRDAMHLCCIPSRPEVNDELYIDIIMWPCKLTEQDCTFVTHGNGIIAGLSLLQPATITSLEVSILRLEARIQRSQDILDVAHRRAYVKRMLIILGDAFRALRSTPALPSRLHRLLTELRRAWLLMTGWLNYMALYRERITSGCAPRPNTDKVMGFFTYNREDLEIAMLAGIPAWHVQPTSAFSSQRILAVSEAKLIQASVTTALPSPPIPGIFQGGSGDLNQLAAIDHATRLYLLGGIGDSIFDPQPPASVPMVSPFSGPQRTLQRTASTSNPATRYSPHLKNTTTGQSRRGRPASKQSKGFVKFFLELNKQLNSYSCEVCQCVNAS
jgi:hypothetical protein